ncbi:hypothetical protein [Streptomyces sp. AB3(2024)]|uniref:hypothetical protein n=1 Tax=Streptomyces sp. AB3(2024) TaxID=3317321 RepID=UPI0035A39A19
MALIWALTEADAGEDSGDAVGGCGYGVNGELHGTYEEAVEGLPPAGEAAMVALGRRPMAAGGEPCRLSATMIKA